MDQADAVIHANGAKAMMPGDPDRRIRVAAAAAGALGRSDGDRRIHAAGHAARAACRDPDAADLRQRRLAAAQAAAAVPLTKAHALPVLPDISRLDAVLAELRQPAVRARQAPRRSALASRCPAVAPSSAARAASPAPLLRGGHIAYWDFRDHIARDIRRGRVLPTPDDIVRHAVGQYEVNVADAAAWCDRFCGQVQRDLRRRR